MCGIALTINGNWSETTTMTKAQSARGFSCHFHDSPEAKLKVGFNYLPIVGSYPQPYIDRNIKMWFNGYISNWRELGYEGENDTEVLGKFMSDGGDPYQLNGFFAIVILNRHTLHISYLTDRYGIKSLYRYHDSDTGTTYVASEVKSILSVVPVHLNPSAVYDYENTLGILTKHTIYQGIERITPLTLPTPPTKLQITYEDAKELLTFYLSKAIERNRTTLTTGVFLSGGVDSGFLALTLTPDYCLSMDYQSLDHSEIENIKLNSTGRHLTMIHNQETIERYTIPALNAVDHLKVGAFYTNYALTELAHTQGVRVLYSGAGADEIFKGYTHRYSKPIRDVLTRTKIHQPYPEDSPMFLNHEQYDWLYLSGILAIEDQISGAFAIETRYPFLDNDLVNFVRSIPQEYLTNKKIFKDVSGLDHQVLSSPKKGFCNPISNDDWVTIAINHKYDKYLRPKPPVPSVEPDSLNRNNPRLRDDG